MSRFNEKDEFLQKLERAKKLVLNRNDDAAKRLLFECLKYFDDEHIISSKLTSLKYLIDVQLNLREYDKAKSLLIDFESEYLEYEKTIPSEIYHSYGRLYSNLGEVHKSIKYYRKAKQIIKNEKVQTVLTQEPFGNLLAWLVLHGYCIKLVNMMCQDYIKYIKVSHRNIFSKYSLMFLNWLCLKISCRRTDVIVLSKDLKKKAVGYGSKKITPLPIYGINLKIFYPQRKKMEGTNLVIVARLSPEKGHKYLFEALKKINEDNPNWILHVIGGGPLQEDLEELRNDLGLKGKIFFYGYLEHKEVAEYYNSSDLFILPSLEEGLGYVSGEALACGCPVIASNVGGIPDIVIDGKTGLLFEPKDVDDLKDKINYMINNKNDALKMAEAGRQHIIKNYNGEKVMEQFESILRP